MSETKVPGAQLRLLEPIFFPEIAYLSRCLTVRKEYDLHIHEYDIKEKSRKLKQKGKQLHSPNIHQNIKDSSPLIKR